MEPPPLQQVPNPKRGRQVSEEAPVAVTTLKKERSDFDVTLDAIETVESHRPTREQIDIFRFVSQGQGNAMIDAVAGSGKTSTILQCLWFLPPASRILVISFNKSVQSVFEKRLLTMQHFMANALGVSSASFPVCEVRTCHSLGWRILQDEYRVDFNEDKFKKRDIIQVLINEYPDEELQKALKCWKHALAQLLSLLMQVAVDCSPETRWSEAFIRGVAEKYDIYLPSVQYGRSRKARAETQVAHVFMSLLRAAYERNCASTEAFDFTDMVYLPVKQGLEFPHYDYVFVDESQDINAIQMEMVERTLRPDTGRAFFVGDRNQSIYGFRGADPDAIRTIHRRFQAHEMPLWTCWRCPVAVIRSAQQQVPRIKSRAGAPEGVSATVSEEDMYDLLAEYAQLPDESTCVLCRTNAPLVELCTELMRRKISAVVKSPSMRAALRTLLNTIKRATWLGARDSLQKRANAYCEWLQRSAREEGQDRVENMDKLETLMCLIDGLVEDSPDTRIEAAHVEVQINHVFGGHGGQKKGTIELSTIHQIKGQEKDNVFIHRTDLLPHPFARGEWQRGQEENLKYVAITRSKSTLYFVEGPEEDSEEGYH